MSKLTDKLPKWKFLSLHRKCFSRFQMCNYYFNFFSFFSLLACSHCIYLFDLFRFISLKHDLVESSVQKFNYARMLLLAPILLARPWTASNILLCKMLGINKQFPRMSYTWVSN